MKTNYDKVMDWVFLSEGGYAERDSEPGGAVNMGISFTAFKDFWGNQKGKRQPTFADLKALTRDEAEFIYQTWFFDPLRFNQLPSGVDYAFVDFAVNSGTGGSIRSVQRAMEFPVTGKVADGFFWALRNRAPASVVHAIQTARLSLMQASSKWPRWEKNWTRRLALVNDRCAKMIDGEDDNPTS